MSKANLDSDLYGDIYGDDYNEYEVTIQDANPQEQVKTEETQHEVPKDPSPEPDAQSSKNPTLVGQDAHRSLPAKPSVQSAQAAQLSYSAQVAKQFSVYQQTPSQERQQRAEIPLPRNPRDPRTTNAIALTPADGQQTSDPDSVFGKKPSEMHDAGKMFIGGLNWDTTDEGLRDYFQQFGKVDACTIMREPDGTSRGFAFLTFEDPAAVNSVVAREHVLDGKGIDPKRAIPREEHLRNTRYFVGGLSASTTSDSMREFFAAYGKVVDATVMLDRESGRSKGFGFVTFEDASNTDQMVGKIGLTLDDKEIEVKLAQPRSQRDQTRNLVGKITNNREQEREQQQQQQQFIQPANTSFPSPNPMAMMFQRSMNQMPMMGASMPMMNMPMMGMGMGMNGFGGMGGGISPMNMMAGMNGFANGGMGNVGAMRLGMGPIGGGMPNFGMMGGTPMGASAMGMRPGMNGLGGMMNANAVNGRAAMNAGPGPNRMTTRGQHSFHPYAR